MFILNVIVTINDDFLTSAGLCQNVHSLFKHMENSDVSKNLLLFHFLPLYVHKLSSLCFCLSRYNILLNKKFVSSCWSFVTVFEVFAKTKCFFYIVSCLNHYIESENIVVSPKTKFIQRWGPK